LIDEDIKMVLDIYDPSRHSRDAKQKVLVQRLFPDNKGDVCFLFGGSYAKGDVLLVEAFSFHKRSGSSLLMPMQIFSRWIFMMMPREWFSLLRITPYNYYGREIPLVSPNAKKGVQLVESSLLMRVLLVEPDAKRASSFSMLSFDAKQK
jgi:hypothetical protein